MSFFSPNIGCSVLETKLGKGVFGIGDVLISTTAFLWESEGFGDF
jgi:hypothetical protein